MGILSFLSGSKKAMDIADKATDGIISGIDKLFFTDEEKSEASAKVVEFVLERAKIAANESSVRSMTRRFVALTFCIPFVAISLFAVVIYRWDAQWAGFSLQVAGSWKNIIIAIILWFFGSYGVGYLIDKKNKQ